MFAKVYEKMKRYIKDNWKFLLGLAIVFLLCIIKLPYYIYTGGGTIDINDRVEVVDGYESKGSFNFAYVTQLRGTIPTYLLSYLIPSWEVEKIEDYQLSSDETEEDVSFRDRLSLEVANQAAIKVAYEKAGKSFDIQNEHHFVNYIAEEAVTELKIGDEILSVDGKESDTVAALRDYIATKEVGDELVFLIERDGKEKKVTAKVQIINGEKLIGISFETLYDYETDPAVKLKFAASESGPSGGLMLTLSIYNKLVEEDITHGQKIVGTGTIDEDGNVGQIGGVNFKLAGAVKEKADYFLVPKGENYDTCIELQKKYHYEITIVPIETFAEAVTFLENLGV